MDDRQTEDLNLERVRRCEFGVISFNLAALWNGVVSVAAGFPLVSGIDWVGGAAGGNILQATRRPDSGG